MSSSIRSITAKINEISVAILRLLDIEDSIQGKFTGAGKQECNTHRQQGEIEFIAVAFSRSNRPIQEKTIHEVDLDNCRDHFDCEARRGEPGKETEEHCETAKKFGAHDDQRQIGRHVN